MTRKANSALPPICLGNQWCLRHFGYKSKPPGPASTIQRLYQCLKVFGRGREKIAKFRRWKVNKFLLNCFLGQSQGLNMAAENPDFPSWIFEFTPFPGIGLISFSFPKKKLPICVFWENLSGRIYLWYQLHHRSSCPVSACLACLFGGLQGATARRQANAISTVDASEIPRPTTWHVWNHLGCKKPCT